MSSNKRIILPVMPMASWGTAAARLTECDELVFDPREMRYKTRSQQAEIEELKSKLEDKERKRAEGVRNIIGYFYSRKN